MAVHICGSLKGSKFRNLIEYAAKFPLSNNENVLPKERNLKMMAFMDGGPMCLRGNLTQKREYKMIR